MENKATQVTVTTTVNANVEKVWKNWSTPADIIKWCSPSEEWHTPRAENDLRAGGKFLSRMEAKDGSMGFDLTGVYDEVNMHELITYTMADGRKVKVAFTANGNETAIEETFDAEDQNPVEMQRLGWQAILDSFKKYTEGNN